MSKEHQKKKKFVERHSILLQEQAIIEIIQQEMGGENKTLGTKTIFFKDCKERFSRS
jgi:hypothetical protein